MHIEAIRLGKKYVHNDICFPAQIVIGEALAALESGQYEPSKTAIGMGKYIGDCRLTHYSALLRKALDDAGYSEVAILTNDDVDYHNLHPGFKMNLVSSLRLAAALPMIDILEELLRKIRPYECVEDSADHAENGCLPNHVVGRGISKKFHEMYPDAQILPLDYDPDISFANLENRLQMLIMSIKEQEIQ